MKIIPGLCVVIGIIVLDWHFAACQNCPKFDDFPGKVKYRRKGSRVAFRCYKKFQRYGNKVLNCNNDGTWDGEPPVCLKPGCVPLNPPSNLDMAESNKGALIKFSCEGGYTLLGATEAYCDGNKWSAPLPNCIATSDLTECDFETDLCGWSQDEDTDQRDWTRGTGPTSTGSTGPSYDHTFGETARGHYMYFEASTPTMTGDKAWLVSPRYTSDMSPMCFDFWYHILGPEEESHVGMLEVFVQRPEEFLDELTPLFTIQGNKGDTWHRGEITIAEQIEDYQIVIVATRTLSYISDIAIDDVRLFNCTQTTTSTTTATTAMPTTSLQTTTAKAMVTTAADVVTTTADKATVTKTSTSKLSTQRSATTKSKVPTTKMTKPATTSKRTTPSTTTKTTTRRTVITTKETKTSSTPKTKPTTVTSSPTKRTSPPATTRVPTKPPTTATKARKPTTKQTTKQTTRAPTSRKRTTPTTKKRTTRPSTTKKLLTSPVVTTRPTTTTTPAAVTTTQRLTPSTRLTTSVTVTRKPYTTTNTRIPTTKIKTDRATTQVVTTTKKPTTTSNITSTTKMTSAPLTVASSTSSSKMTTKQYTTNMPKDITTKAKTTKTTLSNRITTEPQKTSSESVKNNMTVTTHVNAIDENPTTNATVSVASAREKHPEDDTLKPLMIGLGVGIVCGLIIIGTIVWVCVRRRKMFYTQMGEDELRPITNAESSHSLNDIDFYQDEEFESNS